jgi:hypothetical protein
MEEKDSSGIYNLSDYEIDVDRMIAYYQSAEIRETYIEKYFFLDHWLETRKYSSTELNFFIQLLKLRLNQALRDSYLETWANIPQEDFELDETKLSDRYKAIFQLLNDLGDSQEYSDNRFEEDEEESEVDELKKRYDLETLKPIDDKFLFNPIRRPLFEMAEIWTIENEYIVNGKWKSIKGKLGTFMNLLISLRILINDRTVLEKELCERYDCEMLDTLRKPTKSKMYEEEFLGLRAKLLNSLNQ